MTTNGNRWHQKLTYNIQYIKHVIIELQKDFINETVPEDREFFCNELKSVAESPKFMNCFGFMTANVFNIL